MASSPITSWQMDEETVETVTEFILGGSKITVDSERSYEIKKHTLHGRNYDKYMQGIKRQRHHFADKDSYSQSYGFSSSHV